jgi:hypothetical protein
MTPSNKIEYWTQTDSNSASFPEDKVHTLSSNEHISVENDGEVKTQ